MTELSAPYRFVPLSRYVLMPEWGKKVSQDIPFSDGVTGELQIRLTAQTPLCVGGKQSLANDHTPGSVYFSETPDGHHAIPPTSIKGMLREVIKIAGFGRFDQVDDQQLGVRDISKGRNFYSEAMNRSPVSTGWLNYVDGRWQITPCSYVRIEQEKLIKHFGISAQDWNSRKTAAERYQLLGDTPALNFDIEPYKYDCKQQACQLGKGRHKGRVVVTGQPGADFKGRSGKKRDFVFYAEDPEQTLTVSPHVMKGFISIHEDSSEWKSWKDKLKADQLELGIPVFFHRKGEEVVSLGLARMYRLPYTNSLHDAVANTQAAHLEAGLPDLADLLFGWIDEDAEGVSARGRVWPGWLYKTSEHEAVFSPATVLSNPKPSFYPAYIKQSANGKYTTLMDSRAELAGWKRYPVQKDYEFPQLSELVARNKKVQVRLQYLPKETQFEGRLRFHNLRLIELGALLWALDFGQRDELSHSLGMGKPYGLGRVKLEINTIKIRPNGNQVSLMQDNIETAARYAFEHFMDQVWQKATLDSEARWRHSPQAVTLLEYADAEQSSEKELRYYEQPKAFVQAKQEGDGLRFSQQVADVELKDTDLTPTAFDNVPLEQLNELAAEAEAQRRAQQQAIADKKQREAERAEMSDEERLFDVVKTYVESGSELSKTEKDNLAKGINGITDAWSYWPDDSRENVVAFAQSELVKFCDALGYKKVTKAANKLVKRIEEG
ncbi:TIGR03986 family type III CRISPR-associated RAMP protein [Nitrincola tapanii]|uniref:TIGR03986 family CRISPR-associated RAMP protein n=1 Tax=Nitrincola tapanii TaxID=1708751 RepID=A0A5A9W2L1_9GAMM|nr:TIGR03986 family CRISPR-associated RAMP protein [Nitrincola tapanii]KAA0874793.1 TIGR03986 family CRISPR-associated RAMP protein [Nitrincola tapanii]